MPVTSWTITIGCVWPWMSGFQHVKREVTGRALVQVIHAGPAAQRPVGQLWAPRAGCPVLWMPPLRSGLPLRKPARGLGQSRPPQTVHSLLQAAGLAFLLHLSDMPGSLWERLMPGMEPLYHVQARLPAAAKLPSEPCICSLSDTQSH